MIFTPGEPFDFNNVQDEPEFHRLLGQRYTEFEDNLDKIAPNETRQLWHTPTELFSPYYGEAVARYLVANYKISGYPYDDLIIYEMGAGNGTLMANILDYIRAIEPQVYDRTRFKIIEISSNLASQQARQLMKNADARGHAAKVEIINKSIFDWTQRVPEPCYFLAMEVFDNFAHDAIRYDPATEEPLQGTVLIDAKGDFYDFYIPTLDPVAARFLRIRHAATDGRYPSPLSSSRFVRGLRSRIPFMPNLSDPEYIPTRLMQFFDILAKHFPRHRLLTSDFHSLPDAVKGINAPVVQTRYQRRMVPVSTPLVCLLLSLPSLPSPPPFPSNFRTRSRKEEKKIKTEANIANKSFNQVHQGYFDILFPTNFAVLESMYRAMTGKLTRVSTHEEFLRRWAYVEETETKSGENPLLSWYKNASVMSTV